MSDTSYFKNMVDKMTPEGAAQFVAEIIKISAVEDHIKSRQLAIATKALFKLSEKTIGFGIAERAITEMRQYGNVFEDQE